MKAGTWYNAVDDYVPEVIPPRIYNIHLIEKILTFAGNSNGRVFGGFVRDFIIPKEINPDCPVNFNDVDIWFTKQSDADEFVENVIQFAESRGNIFFSKSLCYLREPGVSHYTFGRIQYGLWIEDKFVSFIDIVVSETIPVDDFNVNCLTYHYSSTGKIPQSFSEDSTAKLIAAIATKQAYMLPSYIKKVLSGKLSCNLFEQRLNRIFLSKGWKVYCLDQCLLPNPVVYSWLQSTFKYTARKYFGILENSANLLSEHPPCGLPKEIHTFEPPQIDLPCKVPGATCTFRLPQNLSDHPEVVASLTLPKDPSEFESAFTCTFELPEPTPHEVPCTTKPRRHSSPSST